MANLTLVHNAFDTNDKSVIQLKQNELFTPLYNVIPKYIKDVKDFDFVFSVNGIITENLNVMLKKGDHLAVVPIPAGGGGGKNVLRIVALVALVVVAPYIAGYALTGAFAATTGFAASALSTGIVVAGGLLVNSLIPVQGLSTADASDLESVSPTYSFTAASNANVEGTALPLVLGKASITPPIISSYISLREDLQYLNILYAVNDGKIDSIQNVSINDKDSDSFEGVEFFRRDGSNNQTVMTGFTDSVFTNAVGVSLNDNITQTTQTTSGNNVQELQVGIFLPQGHFTINDSGDYTLPSSPMEFRIEWKKSDETTWTPITRNVYTYEWVYLDDNNNEVIYDSYKGENFKVTDTSGDDGGGGDWGDGWGSSDGWGDGSDYGDMANEEGGWA